MTREMKVDEQQTDSSPSKPISSAEKFCGLHRPSCTCANRVHALVLRGTASTRQCTQAIIAQYLYEVVSTRRYSLSGTDIQGA